jgi:thiosulfate/3-mercaptopyruvate sulfurtransferase
MLQSSHSFLIFRNVTLLTLFLAISFTACTPKPPAGPPTYPNATLLLSADDFDQAASSENTIIVDTRTSYEAFMAAHIPGAVYFHARRDLEDANHPVRHFLIDAEAFELAMQALGLHNNSRVLIYDEGNALGSARLFYALEYYGHTGPISVLDGGFAGWQAASKPVASVEEGEPIEVQSASGTFTSRIQEDRQCDLAYVTGIQPGDNRIIFDVRSAEEFEGTDVRAAEGGHIPGAVNMEWSSVLMDGEVPYFLPFEEIRDLYASLGITPDKEVIPHCHTNVRGSHAYFALRLMGYDEIRPFEGSWSEYGNAAGVPVQR